MKKKTITALALSGLLTTGWAQETTTQASEDVENTEQASTKVVEENDSTDKEEDMENEMTYTEYSGVIDSEDLVSADIYNLQEETIGSIDRILINSESGQIEHAVVSVGGFLGIGDRLVAVPWSSFDIKQEMQMKETAMTEEEAEEEIEKAESEEDKAKTEAAEEAAEEKEEAAEEREENAEEVEADETAPVLHIYLDADQARLENAPEYDPDQPNQIGSSEFWNKEWKADDAEKMKDEEEAAVGAAE